MQETSVFWLRAAVALYAIGLFHTIQVAVRKGRSWFRLALRAFCVAVVLHAVALVETSLAVNHFPAEGFYNSISLAALLLAVLFLFVYWKYKFESLGVFVFPMVFVMAGVASTQAQAGQWSDRTTRDTWLVIHIVFVLAGYASLILTALASLFYLVQERQLKRKKSIALLERLPPLGTLDTLIARLMGVSFVFITLGVITGGTWAFIESGVSWIDARLTTALVTWGCCLLMIFLRVTAGWRGRKAAVLAMAVIACSAATWAVHYVSR